jgi:transposase
VQLPRATRPPLERQARRMRREGLTIDSQTLWDQLEALAAVLQPSYEALGRHVLTAPVIGADETWWRFLQGRGAKRWWAWSVTREDAVTYTILASRSQDAARQVLNGYGGIVIADGYGAYDALARAGPRFTLAHCWAHVRRKFVEAEPHYPGPCGEVLALIGQLYAVERAGPSGEALASEDGRAEVLRLRAAARREHSIAIVDAIHAWALSATGATREQSRQGDRVHGGAVAGAHALSRRCAHPPGQQRHRAWPQRDGRGKKKSLWLPLPAWDRGRRALL